MQKKAVVLFSGGLDSTTCVAIAQSEGFEVYTLSFNYGQNHSAELDRAKDLAKTFNVKAHHLLSLPISDYKGSSLTDAAMDIPDYAKDEGIPNTYVPARNTIFLSYALGLAEVIGAQDIFIGANEVDYSGYPDCRPDYLYAFEQVANLATKAGREGKSFNIRSPLLRLSKADIIKLGIKLGIDYGLTVSCYRADKDGHACGTCDSCVYRKKGFDEAGVEDPTIYQTEKPC